jgi:hypothetical protein
VDLVAGILQFRVPLAIGQRPPANDGLDAIKEALKIAYEAAAAF